MSDDDPRKSSKEKVQSPLLDAFGGYTETLRKATGMSHEKLGEVIDVGWRTLFRIDKGYAEAGVDTMRTYLAYVQGSFTDLQALIDLPTPTRADGVKRAQQRLARNKAGLADPRLDALVGRIVEAVVEHPDLVARLDGYLDNLGAPKSPPL